MSFDSTILIATHDGPFHGDDVLAVAILSTICKNHLVVRTRDPEELEKATYVVDVGGIYDHRARRYDHHMSNPPVDKYEHMYSSAGLIWKHYYRSYLLAIGIPKTYTHKHRAIDLLDQVEKIIRTRWIYPIDRNDNGVANGPTPISDIVSAMAPITGEKNRKRYDECFLEAVSLVSHIFKRACFHAVDYAVSKHHYMLSEKLYLEDDRILVAKTDVRNFSNFSSTSVHFVIYPVIDYNDGNRGYFIIRPIYEKTDKYYKTSIPTDLLGLDRSSLLEKGIEGISFIHHSGFMIRADNESAAIELCKQFLQN